MEKGRGGKGGIKRFRLERKKKSFKEDNDSQLKINKGCIFDGE